MTSTRASLRYLQNEKKRQSLKGEVITLLKSNTTLNEEEKKKFINCYLQENSIESTAYKLNKNVDEIALLYYSLTTSLAKASFSSLIQN